MTKDLTIQVNNKIELLQGYIAAVNWTLGSNMLTESEVITLSYLMYYNEVYFSIDREFRGDLLFSNTVKKKIKQEFNLEGVKLDTYIGKLRKKGIIVNNNLISIFDIKVEDALSIKYTFKIKTILEEQQEVNIQTPEIPTVDPPAIQETTNFNNDIFEEEW